MPGALLLQHSAFASPAAMWINAWRCIASAAVGILAALATPTVCPAAPVEARRDLARVEVTGPVLSFPLPVLEHFQDRSGAEYFLVLADQADLSRAGWPYRILARHARPGEFILAARGRPASADAPLKGFQVVHDDGIRLLVRGAEAEFEALADLGFAVYRLAAQPIVWKQPPIAPLDASPGNRPAGAESAEALVREIVARCDTNHLYGLMTRLTGDEAAVMAGDLYATTTRNTTSGTPINRAIGFVSEHLSALGMAVSNQYWTMSGYSGTNVIASWPGGVKSNEIVIVIAHLDANPVAPPAPGADDNATGSATVIAAAEIFRQYRFERTVRFVLVTGEEQGILGSDVYAASVVAAGDNVLWVLNVDMLGYDGNKDGILELHTRLTSAPGYSNDLQIASAFTNVVASCALGSILKPSIMANSFDWSDHRWFWNRGIPAIMAIEDWSNDHTPYYHQSGDALSTLNWPYFVTYSRAAVGTLAQLAVPTDRAAFDMIEVATVPAATGTVVGAGVFYAGHADGATEAGGDPFDAGWSNAPPNPYARWLKILTAPYADELSSDLRPTDSETMFQGRLVAVDTNGTMGVSCTNRLRFDFISPPATNRAYLARVHVDGQYTADSNAFHCVTNLRTLTAAGRYLQLPELRQVSNGVAYGTCDIAERFLLPISSNCVLDGLSVGASQVVCSASAQCGARICDAVEASTNLLDPGGGWRFLAAFTNDVQPDESGFDSGWRSVARPIDAERLTNSPSFYFRLKRSRLDW